MKSIFPRFPFYLFQSGFSRTAYLIQAVLLWLDPKPERKRTLAFFWNGMQLRKAVFIGRQDYPVYVINRSRDVDRLKKFSTSCSKWGVEFHRVEGVDIDNQPALLQCYRERISNTCYNSPHFVKGIYGCFLGHREAWRKILSSPGDWGMVCEDDARFLGPIPKTISQYNLPKGAEFVFCNQRMGEGLFEKIKKNRDYKFGSVFEFFSTGEALKLLCEQKWSVGAPGGDCYLLSKVGAGKLLDIFEKTKMAFDVDWFMLFQGIQENEFHEFLRDDRSGRFDGYARHSTQLLSYVIAPSIVEQAEGESKVRRFEFCSRQQLFEKNTANSVLTPKSLKAFHAASLYEQLRIHQIGKNLQSRELLKAAIVFETIVNFFNKKCSRSNYIYFIRNRLILKKIYINCRGPRDYAVYLINLDNDLERLVSFNASAKKFQVNYHRISALDARQKNTDFSSYKHLLGEKFYGGDFFPRGSFASFLSHRQVWLKFLETSDPIALICEDDTLLLGRLPKSFQEFQMPADSDVIFVNTRMAEGFFNKSGFKKLHSNAPTFFPVFDALINICKSKIFIGGPGLDGYILTRSGAEKLIKLYDELKYTMNNDWFVVFNSLSSSEREIFLHEEGSDRFKTIALPEKATLKSFVMLPCLVELGDFGTSIAMHEQKLLTLREDL
jgi:GR25 family glycosyltransferase involved in LPS biosynthesis